VLIANWHQETKNIFGRKRLKRDKNGWKSVLTPISQAEAPCGPGDCNLKS
jgi:hypothetical protein